MGDCGPAIPNLRVTGSNPVGVANLSSDLRIARRSLGNGLDSCDCALFAIWAKFA